MDPFVAEPGRVPPRRVQPASNLGLGATAGVVAALVVAVVVFATTVAHPSGRAPTGAVASPPGSSSAALASKATIVPSSRAAGPAATDSSRAPSAACAVTRPDPVFVPPERFVPTPPAYYGSAWYGNARLWTMLHTGGETWGPGLSATPQGLPQKTFWWSADWVPQDELQPAITVTGQRLDASGSFRFGDPGTNATADFGTAMLVGIDVPTYGCWRITARYRGASLSYVASIVDH